MKTYSIKDRDGNITRIYVGLDRRVFLRYMPHYDRAHAVTEIGRDEAALQLLAARIAKKEIVRNVL